MTDLPSIQEIVDKELFCDHPTTEIRYKLDRLNRRLYVKQCPGCGAQVGNSIKHSSITFPMDVDPFNQALHDGYEKLRRSKYRQLANERKKQQREEFFIDYAEYLASEEWKRKSLAVLQRDNFKCTARLPGCLGRASIAHHLTYDHKKNEPLFDLTSVCSKCHKALHPEHD